MLAVLVNSRSATAGAMSLIAVAKSDVLFAGTGSIVEADTVAVLTRVPGAAVASTVKVAVMLRVWPEANVPRLHGKAVVQSPVFETNVSPGGAGSSTVTACAVAGPAFVTVSWYEIVSPGRASASPLLMIRRSADGGNTAVVTLGVVAGIAIGRRRTLAVLSIEGGPSSGRDQERREDRPRLSGGHGAERTGKRRRAIAGVAHERQTGRRGVRHRDTRGVARPVLPTTIA